MKMGTYFKRSIFDEHIQAGLVSWAQKAKKRHGLKASTEGSGPGPGPGSGSGSGQGSSAAVARVQLARIGRKDQILEETHTPTGS